MELEAYVDMMPAIRAERMLDAAQVAVYPLHVQHAHESASSWWARLVEDSQATLRQITERRREAARSLFSFNGIAVGFSELKSRLAGALGGGLRG